jgi:hypothetical protein
MASDIRPEDLIKEEDVAFISCDFYVLILGDYCYQRAKSFVLCFFGTSVQIIMAGIA